MSLLKTLLLAANANAADDEIPTRPYVPARMEEVFNEEPQTVEGQGISLRNLENICTVQSDSLINMRAVLAADAALVDARTLTGPERVAYAKENAEAYLKEKNEKALEMMEAAEREIRELELKGSTWDERMKKASMESIVEEIRMASNAIYDLLDASNDTVSLGMSDGESIKDNHHIINGNDLSLVNRLGSWGLEKRDVEAVVTKLAYSLHLECDADSLVSKRPTSSAGEATSERRTSDFSIELEGKSVSDFALEAREAIVKRRAKLDEATRQFVDVWSGPLPEQSL